MILKLYKFSCTTLENYQSINIFSSDFKEKLQSTTFYVYKYKCIFIDLGLFKINNKYHNYLHRYV